MMVLMMIKLTMTMMVMVVILFGVDDPKLASMMHQNHDRR